MNLFGVVGMPRRADLGAQTGKAVHHVLPQLSDGLLNEAELQQRCVKGVARERFDHPAHRLGRLCHHH
jgi:hypothetical protein